MAQSLSKIWVHVIFSTKGRVPSLNSEIRRELYAYAASVLRNLESPATRIGGRKITSTFCAPCPKHVPCEIGGGNREADVVLVEIERKPVPRVLLAKRIRRIFGELV